MQSVAFCLFILVCLCVDRKLTLKRSVQDHLCFVRACAPVRLDMDELLLLARHFKSLVSSTHEISMCAVKQIVDNMKDYLEVGLYGHLVCVLKCWFDCLGWFLLLGP